SSPFVSSFLFHVPATTEIYTLSLHDALPIYGQGEADGAGSPLGVGRQRSGQDRDEDDVVDAEDDLEHREGEEGDPGFGRGEPGRSEEHTSELQSRRDLVCRLLLEKKKKIKKR